jgi:hypothetical protein
MRSFPLALFLLATPAWAADEYPNAPTYATTPSGHGDPETVVCRAPQPLPSGGMGPRICLRNVIWVRLTMTAQDLSADGKSVFKRQLVAEPTGRGDPDAVTCRRPPQSSASRTQRGPMVCLTNKYWAEIAAQDKRVNNNGQLVSTKVNGPSGRGDGIPVLPTELQ